MLQHQVAFFIIFGLIVETKYTTLNLISLELQRKLPGHFVLSSKVLNLLSVEHCT